jgi:hypothetical protein
MLKGIIENGDITAEMGGAKTGSKTLPANNNGHFRKPSGHHKGFIASYSPGSEESLPI